MRKLLFCAAALAFTISTFAFGPAQAIAATCTASTNGSLQLFLKDSCTFPAALEEKVFLDKATGVTAGTGNVGGQTDLPETTFTSSTKIDLANGFANIKANDGSEFKDLTFAIPGFQFGDLLFDIQLQDFDLSKKVKNQTWPLIVEGFNGATSLGVFNFGVNALKKDADLSFMLLATGMQLTSVVFTSFNAGKNGIFEMKHFQVSEVSKINITADPIPLPGGIVLLLSGLAGLAGLGRMRKAAAKA